MSVEAHVYQNDGSGAPPNLASPIATVGAGIYTYATAPLALNSDNTFQVRNFDSVSGLEENNTDARVRILIDAAGNDVTARPNPPAGLSVILVAGGSIRIDWQYAPGGQGAAPTGFHVYVGSPTPNYGSPAVVSHDVHGSPITVVPFETGVVGFSATLTGLATTGSTYSGQVGVRAFNSSIEETNTNVVGFTADAVQPAAVDGLTVTAIP